jgi:Esterase-like activity of phytase
MIPRANVVGGDSPVENRWVGCLAGALALLAAGCASSPSGPWDQASHRLGTPALHGVGHWHVPFRTTFASESGETHIGGLSGIDLDPTASGADPVFLVISDGRAASEPRQTVFPVVYRVRLGIRDDGLAGEPQFIAAQRPLQAPDRPFAPASIDPEALRFDPQRNRIYWTSEEHPPALRAMTPDGIHVAQATLPPGLVSGGILPNGSFEALAITDDGSRLFAAMELPLESDGEPSSPTAPAKIRIVEFSAEPLEPVRQYAYCVDPIRKPPLDPAHAQRRPFDPVVMIGITELLWVAGDVLLVLERGFTRGYPPGQANSARLYAVNLKRAPRVDTPESVRAIDCATYPKAAYLDLETLGIWIDNVEGMSFGPDLANGDGTLVLVTDDNVRATQRTQFIVLQLRRGRP